MPLSDLKRTVIVDQNFGVQGKNPVADYATIKDAIEGISIQSGEYWTILVYPGVYSIDDTSDLIHLGDTKERISIVGIDPNSCLIVVDVAGSGIKITSGDEAARENRIANLTIKTSNGHGIEIVKGSGPNDKTPKNITIENCVILADGSGKAGVDAGSADGVRIVGCNVQSDDAAGVVAGANTFILGSIIHGAGPGMISGSSGVKGLRLLDSVVTSDGIGIHLSAEPTEDVLVRGCLIVGATLGFEMDYVKEAAPFRITESTIIFDGNVNISPSFALRHDVPPMNEDPVVEVERCTLIAKNVGSGGAVTVYRDPGKLRFIDCAFFAESTQKKAICFGDDGGTSGRYEFINCTFSSVCSDEKVDEVYDIEDVDPDNDVFISNCRLSKWLGPIHHVSPPRTQVERILSVSAASDTAIHSGIQLTASEQEVTTGITNPDLYRALKIVGVGTWASSADVWIVGTNLAGDPITGKITLPSGTNPSAEGKKPFKTVTKIIVPAAEQGQSQTIKVGTTDKLGLSSPLSSSSDVLQWSKVSGSAWQIQTSALTVDVNYATINPGGISAGDSFEFTYLTAG